MARDRDTDAPPQPKSDAYTGILILTFLAQIVAGAFLFLDWNEYPTNQPPKAPAVQSGGGAAPPPAAPAPPPAAPAPPAAAPAAPMPMPMPMEKKM